MQQVKKLLSAVSSAYQFFKYLQTTGNRMMETNVKLTAVYANFNTII